MKKDLRRRLEQAAYDEAAECLLGELESHCIVMDSGESIRYILYSPIRKTAWIVHAGGDDFDIEEDYIQNSAGIEADSLTQAINKLDGIITSKVKDK